MRENTGRGIIRYGLKQGLALSGRRLDVILACQCNAFFEIFSLLGRFCSDDEAAVQLCHWSRAALEQQGTDRGARG